MIKKLFLPEKLNGRRLIAQRILGVSIQEHVLYGTQIHAGTSVTTLEKLHSEDIAQGAPTRYQERASEALTKLVSHFSKFDQLRIAIPTSIITFKELTLPFTSIEKIRMVVEYEVESLLPFSIHDAIIDFIIIKQFPDQQSSQILVAAARKQDLQSIFDICASANIDPDVVTIDLFSLYSLYLQIPDYRNLPHASAIVDIGDDVTTIAFLLEGELRLMRTISKGLSTIAQTISNEVGEPVETVTAKLINIGVQPLDTSAYMQATQKAVLQFLNDIQFTLNSFSLKLNFYKEISKILFVGKGAYVNGLMEFGSNTLQTSCDMFAWNKLFRAAEFKNKVTETISQASSFTVALGTAIPYDKYDDFTLRRKNFARLQDPWALRQLFVAAGLALVTLLYVGISGFLQINAHSSLYETEEQKCIKNLQNIFPPNAKQRKESELNSLLKKARDEVNAREANWLPFSTETLKPLEILSDLTKAIDKKLFTVSIEKISIRLTEGETQPSVEVNGLLKQQYSDIKGFESFVKTNCSLLQFEKLDEDFDAPSGGATFTLKFKLKES